MSENSTKKSSSGFLGFLGRNWWKIALGIALVLAILSVWKTISSTLAKALNDLLGLGDSLINSFQQQMSSCGIGTPSPSTCTDDKDCIRGCGRKCKCVQGYCEQCSSDSDCPKGYGCDNNGRCSGGLFASGCWLGIIGLISGGFALIYMLGKLILNRTPKSEVGKQCKAEGADPLEGMDQNKTEADARDAAEDLAEKGETADGKDFTEDMVEGTTENAVRAVARKNAANVLREKVTKDSSLNPTQKTAAEQQINTKEASDEARQAEESKAEGDQAETENEEGEGIADDMVDPIEGLASAIRLYPIHVALANDSGLSATRRSAHRRLAMRHLRRRPQLARLFASPTVDEMALVAPPGKRMHVTPAGIPIMPTTSTCTGATTCGSPDPIEYVECGARCGPYDCNPCCQSRTIYDMNWRSPGFGTAVACARR